MTERERFPYKVLLLKPQALATPYGKDIILYHVAEESADNAILEAQDQAFEAHETEDGDPSDWHVLALIEGHHDNMVPAPEPGRIMTVTPGERGFLDEMLGQIVVHSPSAARTAMAARISRKLSRSAAGDNGPVSIRLSDSEYRVLDNLMWQISTKDPDKSKAATAERLWGKMLQAPADEPG